MSTARYLIGDTRAVVATLPDNSVDLVLSSPPFLALRSYLSNDDPNKGLEIGQEANPAAFLDVLLELTAGWRRVLAPHGSIAIELGDSYSGSGGAGGDYTDTGWRAGQPAFIGSGRRVDVGWPLAKSLALVPELYRVALAYGINPLTGAPSPAGRWRVRNVVRWHRPNPPVGALGDKFRPSTSDMVIACVSDRRWFDLDAVREPAITGDRVMRQTTPTFDPSRSNGHASHGDRMQANNPAGAPPLDTWVIPTHPFSGAHFATWPPALCVKPIKSMCPERVCTTCGEPSRRIVETIEPRVVNENDGGKDRTQGRHVGGVFAKSHTVTAAVTRDAGWTDCGCRCGECFNCTDAHLLGETCTGKWRAGVVLDPFGGSGTTGAVATGLGRDAVLIDLDARNAELARERIGMFLDVTEGVQQ